MDMSRVVYRMKVKHIVQVGLNRMPDWVYFRCLLDEFLEARKAAQDEDQAEDNDGEKRKEDELEGLLDIGDVWRPFSDRMDIDAVFPYNEMRYQSGILEGFEKRHLDELADIMCRSLFAECEQMIFRGIIRNADCSEDYTYHMFIDIDKYPGLFTQMLDRYVPLGAKIEVLPEPPGSILYNLMDRGGMRGVKTQVQRLVEWHDKELREGDKYTDAEMRKAAGSATDSSWRKFKTTHRQWLRPMLELDGTSERTVYTKTANWYFD